MELINLKCQKVRLLNRIQKLARKSKKDVQNRLILSKRDPRINVAVKKKLAGNSAGLTGLFKTIYNSFTHVKIKEFVMRRFLPM